MQILFCRKNQKNVLQKEIKKGTQFLIPVDWIIENYLCQILYVVLEFFVKGTGFGLFFTA